MFISFSTVNFDTEFRIPPGCRPSGTVDCRVVRARCVVVHEFSEWVTFKVILVLEIRIRSGRRTCRFFKEIAVKETVWLDVDKRIRECEVVAAACRCVSNWGRVHCNLTVKVRFFLEQQFHDPCMSFNHHHGSDEGDHWGEDVMMWERDGGHGRPLPGWSGDSSGGDSPKGDGSGGDSSGGSLSAGNSFGRHSSGGEPSGGESHWKQDDGGCHAMGSRASRSR
jgi:uncharacterized membrane protein YgcG